MTLVSVLTFVRSKSSYSAVNVGELRALYHDCYDGTDDTEEGGVELNTAY